MKSNEVHQGTDAEECSRVPFVSLRALHQFAFTATPVRVYNRAPVSPQLSMHDTSTFGAVADSVSFGYAILWEVRARCEVGS